MEKRSRTPGYRKQIAFISCSKRKRAFPGKAKEVYQGTLFRKAFRYCSNKFDRVFILSAKYGLLDPDKIIIPYEQTLNKMSFYERKAWTDKVKKQIEKRKITGVFWFFTGVKYNEFFEGKKPLIGLSLDQQIHWFNLRLEEKGFDL